jgi:alanyl-tRNA synthetase
MIDEILKNECDLQFFHQNGYVRKQCKSCGAYYWTLNSDQNFCGDQPCVKFNFIGNPITKKPFSLTDVRESFLTFFEQHNHSRISYPVTGNRCPVIARWRTDIYLTIASIADFQPHVTSGEVPPPANPLVISQPCIRLNDLEEVGSSGRHLTTFEMMGHHAFNKNTDEIYWKEETVAYCDEYFQTCIGIPRELINYKEHMWIGGGNAGPCIEVLAGGLEIATLVFMNMKQDSQGPLLIEDQQYTQNPLNIVDTGYGLERIAWYTQGTPTIYETVVPHMITFLLENIKQTSMPEIYALADHTKCLAFMLGDGIVPSNVKAGYLARLIIRRALRFIEHLNLHIPLREIVSMQIETLYNEFPSLKDEQRQIEEILDIETKRYKDTLSKGESLVKKILSDHQTIDTSTLITLYDTHGMPPTIVQNIAQQKGITIEIPPNFDSMIAELHSQEERTLSQKKPPTNLPQTKALYNQDHYIKEFDATVLWSQQTPTDHIIILNQTAFYPEGGGQPSDIGEILYNGQKIPVTLVEKNGSAIIHHVSEPIPINSTIHAMINWTQRYTLMKHHTGTHLVNGALRKVLGEHVWQAGSQLGIQDARFDYAHYKPLTSKEKTLIETQANIYIKQAVPITKKVMTRNDAEHIYGFRLYQGGVPPGNAIRVLDIPGIDVEACGGTHLNNTQEVEKIRILKTERIQDGVNRIIFAAGQKVDEYDQEEETYYRSLISLLTPRYSIQQHDDISTQMQQSAVLFSVPTTQLHKTFKRFLIETQPEQKEISRKNLTEAAEHLFNTWKKQLKNKKKVSQAEISRLTESAEAIPNTSFKLIIATTSHEPTATAGIVIEQPNYIIHISDGYKIISAASENIDIDLRSIAPKIGKILGGSGGGKPKLVQAGGPNLQKIPEALQIAKKETLKFFQK